MAANYSIMVGTTGAGLFHSADSGGKLAAGGQPVSGRVPGKGAGR